MSRRTSKEEEEKRKREQEQGARRRQTNQGSTGTKSSAVSQAATQKQTQANAQQARNRKSTDTRANAGKTTTLAKAKQAAETAAATQARNRKSTDTRANSGKSAAQTAKPKNTGTQATGSAANRKSTDTRANSGNTASGKPILRTMGRTAAKKAAEKVTSTDKGKQALETEKRMMGILARYRFVDDMNARTAQRQSNILSNREVPGARTGAAKEILGTEDFRPQWSPDAPDSMAHPNPSGLDRIAKDLDLRDKAYGLGKDKVSMADILAAAALDPLSALKADSHSHANFGRGYGMKSKAWDSGLTDREKVKAGIGRLSDQMRQDRRQRSAANQTLSRYDKKLREQFQDEIKLAKADYNSAKARGDTAGMQAAHKRAETWRRIEGGYSGGATGMEHITPKLEQRDVSTLNKTGQTQLRAAKLGYENAQTDQERARYAAMGQDIRRNPAYLKETYDRGAYRETDANGRMRYAGTAEERAKEAEQGAAIPKAIGTGIAGAFLSLPGTTARALQTDAARNQAALQQLSDIRGGGEVRVSAPAPLTEETLGQRLLRRSDEYREKATEGQTGLNRYLTEALITGGEMIPGLAATALTGGMAAPGLAVMGAQAAGRRMGDLERQGEDPVRAFNRGLATGLIEAATERVPLGNLTKIAKGGGKSFARNMLTQALEEVGTEELSEIGNYAADKAFGDPNASLTAQDLKDTAVISLLTSLGMGAGAGIVGGRRTGQTGRQPEGRTTDQAGTRNGPVRQESAAQTEDSIQAREAQLQVREKALDARAQEALEQMARSTDSDTYYNHFRNKLAQVRQEQAQVRQERARLAETRRQAEISREEAQTRRAEEERIAEESRYQPGRARDAGAELAAGQLSRVNRQAQAARNRLAGEEAPVLTAMRDAIRGAVGQDTARGKQREITPLAPLNVPQRARERAQEPEGSRATSARYGQAENHIDNRVSQDMGDRRVKAFQWDHPEVKPFFRRAAAELKQQAEYADSTKTAQRASAIQQARGKKAGTIMAKNEPIRQLMDRGLSTTDIIQACDAIIHDQGQENYAAAKRVELALDDMLSKGYRPIEAAGWEAEDFVNPNADYLRMKEALPGAVTRGSFEDYLRHNAIALETGEVTEEELRQEWEEDRRIREDRESLYRAAEGWGQNPRRYRTMEDELAAHAERVSEWMDEPEMQDAPEEYWRRYWQQAREEEQRIRAKWAGRETAPRLREYVDPETGELVREERMPAEEAGTAPAVTEAPVRTETVREEGQKNTPQEAEEVVTQQKPAEQAERPHHPKGTDFDDLVVQLRDNLQDLVNMEPVSVVTGKEVPTEGRATERALSFLRKIGMSVFRPGFGEVLFSKSKIKSSFVGHGVGNTKVELIAGVPDVIAKGDQIGFEPNWKGRGYDSYVFAGPVMYKGAPVYIGAIVNKYGQGNRYYLHEVVDQDGNIIYGEEKEPEGIFRQESPEGLNTVIPSDSDNSISETEMERNRKFDEEAENVSDQDPYSVGAAPGGFDPVSEWQESTDRFHPVNPKAEEAEAENWGRAPVDIPVRDPYGQMTSKAASTLVNAGMTPNQISDAFTEMARSGKLSYIPYTDDAATQEAERVIRDNGFQRAKEEWTAEVRAGKMSKDLTTRGIVLYNNAANAGSVVEAIDIATDLIEYAHTAGQILQAVNIINKLGPAGQLYSFASSMDKLEQKIREKQKKDGAHWDGIEIDKDLAKQYMEAQNEEERQAVEKEIKKDIARQIPNTLQDKLDAWRYMAMLGNPRTQIRNLAGNLGFQPVRVAKNIVGAALEQAAGIDKSQRTKSLQFKALSKADRARYQAGLAEYEQVEPTIMGNGKYNDTFSEIDQYRRIFKSKLLEGWRDLTNAGLEKGDVFFAKRTYADSLAGILKARGITAEEYTDPSFDQNRKAEIQAIAVTEAQKATYRDLNQFSKWVSRLGQGPNTPKAVHYLTEGLLPFKKTPANILVRGLEYSPVGLLRGIKDMGTKVKSGEMTAAEGIDELASGLTGTALLGLGVALAASGLITPGDDDDSKQKAFDQLLGKQSYALRLPGGYSFTLDWLSPEAIPFFMGVEAQNSWGNIQSGKKGKDVVWNAVRRISDPMLEMSMLQGVNDLIENVSYADNKFMSILATMATGYLSQFIPTIGGQLERTLEDRRYSTWIDRDSWVPNEVQYLIAKNANKIPGLEYHQREYLNAWGEPEMTGSPLVRALTNFASPGYLKKGGGGEIEAELQRLYDAGFDVFPTIEKTSAKINDKYVTAEQFNLLQGTKGQMMKDFYAKTISSPEYQELSDADKAKVLSREAEYAKSMGQVAAGRPLETLDAWAKNTGSLSESTGIGVAALIEASGMAQAINARKGETPLNKTLAFYDYMDKKKYSTEQQDALTEAYFESNAKTRGYADAIRSGAVSQETMEQFMEAAKEFDVNQNGLDQDETVKTLQSMGLPHDTAKAIFEATGQKNEDGTVKTTYEDKLKAVEKAEEKAAKFAKVPADVLPLFEEASKVQNQGSGYWSYDDLYYTAMAVDTTDENREAWFNAQKPKNYKKSWQQVKNMPHEKR